MAEDKLKIDEMLENEIEAELAEETNDEDVQEYMTEEEYMEKDGMDRLFEGGPTYDQVAEWKSRFNGEIYMSDFGQDTFIWRPLRRNEYKTMQRAEGQNEMFMEESVCRTCVLWPENFGSKGMAFGKAGIPSMLSQIITEKSGFIRPATYKI